MQLFVDAGAPVDDKLVNALIKQVISEKITGMVGQATSTDTADRRTTDPPAATAAPPQPPPLAQYADSTEQSYSEVSNVQHGHICHDMNERQMFRQSGS